MKSKKGPGLFGPFENLRCTRCQDRDEGGDDVYQHPGTNGRTIAEIKRAKTAVPRARSARKPGSSAAKHDILLLNTLSRPFSYSDSARASRQTFQRTSESTKCKGRAIVRSNIAGFMDEDIITPPASLVPTRHAQLFRDTLRGQMQAMIEAIDRAG
jgi:hypothetical protein